MATFRSPLLKKTMPGLDALRGIAIITVLLYHGLHVENDTDLPLHSRAAHVISSVLGSGWLGVFLFFVLSGFLITGNLLDSKGNPDYLRRFYFRRILRIMPPFVLVLIILKMFFGSSWMYIVISLAYCANLDSVLHPPGFIYGPLWSLAVEEQFYLFWPLMVKYLSIRVLTYVAMICVIACPLLRLFSATGFLPLGDPHRMVWLVADNLAIGGLLAILLRSTFGRVSVVTVMIWSLFVMGTAVLALGVPFGVLHWNTPFGTAFKTLAFELIFAGALLVVLRVGDKPVVMTATLPLRFFGYISYGLYLYHGLLFTAYDHLMSTAQIRTRPTEAQWFLRFILVSVLSILLAILSRRLFEEPFLRLDRTAAEVLARKK